MELIDLERSNKSKWLAGLMGCFLWGGAVDGFAATDTIPFGTPVIRPGERQLFLDDFIIGDLNQLTRVIHQPKKYAGNPVIRPDIPTDGTTIQMPDAPIS